MSTFPNRAKQFLPPYVGIPPLIRPPHWGTHFPSQDPMGLQPFCDPFIQTKKQRARQNQTSRKNLRQSEYRPASRLPHRFLRCSSNASPTPPARIASCGRCGNRQFYSSIGFASQVSKGVDTRLCMNETRVLRTRVV